MQLGIIGLPQSGKTTIFNALTKSSVKVGEYSAGAVHIGVVKVPDPRLDVLTKMYNPKKKVPATVTYVDIGGMAKGASGSGGLGAEFLDQMHKVDAIILVLRDFDSAAGPASPAGDYQTIFTELILSDMAMIERRIERVKSDLRKNKRPELEKELHVLEKCQKQLESEQPVRTMGLASDESKLLRSFQLLTEKPLMLVLNHAEAADCKPRSAELKKLTGGEPFVLCGPIEMDIAQMADEDAKSFLEELKIDEPALNRMIRESFRLLGKICFFTVGEDECRAWTIGDGTKAQQAAGTIHSDLERGFIRAETVHYDHLVEAGSFSKARDKGHVRLEGKEYLVKDGDIINVKFNV
jgi:GTP-binding protein YchF